MSQFEIETAKAEGASLARQVMAQEGVEFARAMVSAKSVPNPVGRDVYFWTGFINVLVAA